MNGEDQGEVEVPIIYRTSAREAAVLKDLPALESETVIPTGSLPDEEKKLLLLLVGDVVKPSTKVGSKIYREFTMRITSATNCPEKRDVRENLKIQKNIPAPAAWQRRLVSTLTERTRWWTLQLG